MINHAEHISNPLIANPIFIFATGQRCGSTLIQRFLCSHPRVMIWGEHDGFLALMRSQFHTLYRWEERFRHHRELFLDSGMNNFIANMSPTESEIRQAEMQLICSLWKEPAYRLERNIWGFKEVRYDAEMAVYLKGLFPDTRVIFLTRNIINCFISLQHWERWGGWSRQDTVQFVNHWTSINRSFIESGLGSDWVFSLTYERMTQDPVAITRQLTDWLGMKTDDFDVAIFAHKIYTERYAGPDQRKPIRRSDLTHEDRSLIVTEDILAISSHYGFDMYL